MTAYAGIPSFLKHVPLMDGLLRGRSRFERGKWETDMFSCLLSSAQSPLFLLVCLMAVSMWLAQDSVGKMHALEVGRACSEMFLGGVSVDVARGNA